MQFINNKRQ